MHTFEIKTAALPTGHTVERGSEVVVREQVEYESGRTFEAGESFSVLSIEVVPSDEEIVLHLDEAPLDLIDMGDATQNGFAGLVKKGKFVLLP